MQEAFQEIVVYTPTHRYGCLHPYTHVFYIIERSVAEFRVILKSINLLVPEANLQQTQSYKGNEFMKKDQKTSNTEVDSKWIWNELETNLKQIWKAFEKNFFR